MQVSRSQRTLHSAYNILKEHYCFTRPQVCHLSSYLTSPSSCYLWQSSILYSHHIQAQIYQQGTLTEPLLGKFPGCDSKVLEDIVSARVQ